MNWTNFICSVILFTTGLFIIGYICPSVGDLSMLECLKFLLGMFIWKTGFELEWWKDDKVR